MPFRKIHKDVKWAAVRLYLGGVLGLHDILDCLQVSRASLFRWAKLFRETGSVASRKNVWTHGPKRALHCTDLDCLLTMVRAHPQWFLDELSELLATNHFISVHHTTIHRELVRHDITTKALSKAAKERSALLRAHYTHRIAQYTPEQLGFIDETSKDERTVQLTGTGYLTIDGMTACTTVEGSMTREKFLHFLEHHVVRYNVGLFMTF
ncbi:hypothetical protein FISHEDRAFT_49553 [Fistulina hepatica ATCC 64428]|uniref:Winged helix-turn helix domain-containing protein n=1 Tax=Fistulina hepatica ATCC 64428 TaxID=1128425 RepID=A0A0D7A614_9AGAR|nr:hypothetical protein FISHEDRAFT_49553 [Fistulina hepatica ATCC 64428]